MKRLAIIGSNDLAVLIAHHAISDSGYAIAGFFDNHKSVATPIAPFGEVLGSVRDVEPMFRQRLFDELVIGVGYTQFAFRKDVFVRFRHNIPMANIIHSSAFIDGSCAVGKGVVVLPGCVIDMGVEIEDNVLLNTSVSIAHHSTVKAHSFVGPGVTIAGYTIVGSQCFIGVGTTIIDNITICDEVIVGGGSLIVKDIVEAGTYFGHPARKKP